MRELLILFVVACAPASPADVPLDHRLHDLSSDGDRTRSIRYGGKQVPVADLPIVATSVGLPVAGTADIVIDLAIPKTRGRPDYSRTTGSFVVTCVNCQIGDDHAKLAINVGTDEPLDIELGHLAIDRLEVKGTVANGRVRITSWMLSSPDVEVQLSLSLVLAKTFDDSTVAGCVRFKPTDALRERDPKMHDLLLLTGAARDPDGYDHVALEGTAGETRRLAKLCGTR